MRKSALEVQYVDKGLLRAVANTAGRVNPMRILRQTMTAPGELRLRLDDAARQKISDKVRMMHRMYGSQLQDTVVRIGGPNTRDDLRRLWDKNREMPFFSRVAGTPALFANNTRSALTRTDYFNPLTNSATAYSASPNAIMHELGHAVDFNSLSPYRRAVYGMSTIPEQILMGSGPVSHWQEAAANRNTMRALKRRIENDPDFDDQLEKDYWRRAAAVHGSLIGSTTAAGLGLHAALNQTPGAPDAVGRAFNSLTDGIKSQTGSESDFVNKGLAGLLVGAGGLGLGAIGGQLTGVVRNAMKGQS